MNSFVTRFANMLDTDTLLESSFLSKCCYMDCNEFNVSYKSVCSEQFWVLHINCRSLAAKLERMYELLINECSSVLDIILCSETCLDDSCTPLCNLSGSNLFHHQRDFRRGGVCIYVKNVYVYVQPIDLYFAPATNFQHCQIKITPC